MKRLQQLSKEINELTLKIEQEYPELYRNLDENPVTIAQNSSTKLTTKNFSDYLDSLKQILSHYIENHKNSENS
ncbi:MAG: hypothetical protein RJQ00_06140 [Vicingaceae bacterium]